MSNTNILREHLFTVIMDRVSTESGRRTEALQEFFSVTGTVADSRAERVAELVPPLLPELYAKWVNLFLDRLFETVPEEQIALLGDGSQENNAAAALAYIMFLESERMERQIAEDLAAYGLERSGEDGAEDMGELAAGYIRASMGRIAGSAGGAPGDAGGEQAAPEQRKKSGKQ
jgi:hypothetical protein